MSETAFKTSHSVTTELARINMLAATTRTKFPKFTETTLNSKYNILKDDEITTYPRIAYFGIGINGFQNISSENNISQPNIPLSSNMDLYQSIPFRCVKEPLTADEALKYRMVEKRAINGTYYYLYWLKVLEFESEQPQLTTIVGNRESAYTLDSSRLYPTPGNLAAIDISNANDAYTQVSMTAIRKVTAREVHEAINVMYNGDLRRARISEFGLYSGIDKENVTMDGIPYAYTEAIYVQLANHMCMLGHDMSSPDATLTERCVISTGVSVKAS